MPKVSIIMASYNHERFVQEAIQSVLDQSFQDFELLIIDDASTDNTVNIIKTFHDTRIHLTVLQQNQGQFVATNLGLKKARGEYIGILNSDDAFHPEKLRKQITFLENNQHIAATFSFTEVINEKSRPFKNISDTYSFIFNQSNRTRHEWLNYFFFKGNCLCHASILIRSKCHQELGYYDPRFANCADLQFWIKLTAKYPIHIIQEKLTKFRMMKKEGNMSGNSIVSLKRMRWEDYQAKLQFFYGLLSEEDFLMTFPKAKKYIIKEHTPLLTSYLLARLALDTKNSFFEAMGLRIIFEMMQDINIQKQLSNYYDFQYKDLIQWTGKADPFQMNFLQKSNILNWAKKAFNKLRNIHRFMLNKITP